SAFKRSGRPPKASRLHPQLCVGTSPRGEIIKYVEHKKRPDRPENKVALRGEKPQRDESTLGALSSNHDRFAPTASEHLVFGRGPQSSTLQYLHVVRIDQPKDRRILLPSIKSKK